MSKLKINPKMQIVVLFIAFFAMVRVWVPMSPALDFLANFTVVGALALFAGAYVKSGVKSFALPIGALLVSDLVLSQTIYKTDGFLYEGWYYTYIAFALMVLVGKLMLKKVNVGNVVLSTLAIVFIHWIVTDFGVWFKSPVYPQNLQGFWMCLVAAIPFERAFLTSTLLYSAVMFGGFEFVKAKFPSLKAA